MTEYVMIVATIVLLLISFYNIAGAITDSIVSGVLPFFG
jgi:hypothetical protein